LLPGRLASAPLVLILASGVILAVVWVGCASELVQAESANMMGRKEIASAGDEGRPCPHANAARTLEP
jgi:hypothetical protein